MEITENKRRNKNLGIFYTPKLVVKFIFSILNILKQKEDEEVQRWQNHKPNSHYPSVIDPAVGEGVFLKTAVESGFTKIDWIFGLDIDGNVIKKWKDINLLEEFGGKEKDLEAHFFHQNGLDRIHWEQHISKYQHKLKQKDINAQQFNTVVGNPPYGGIGVYEETKKLSEVAYSLRKITSVGTITKNTLFGEEVEETYKTSSIEHKKVDLGKDKIKELYDLSKALLDFEIWKNKQFQTEHINYNVNINGVKLNYKYLLTLKEIDRLKSFPIEILFIERFIQLAKPGGWIAIIIPDGILTNSNSHYVREFIIKKAKVEAIISLPRSAFKNVGTSAKTSILFLQKYKDQEKRQDNYSVFLASVDSLDEKNFNFIKDTYQKYYNKTMSNKNLVQTITDEKGQEIVTVRVDKTLREMMEEKPASRLDPKYWNPKYDYINDYFNTTKFSIKHLGDFEDVFTQGINPNEDKGSVCNKYNGDSILFLSQSSILRTGIDLLNVDYLKKSSKIHKQSSRPRIGDILLARSGEGGIGKKKWCVYLLKNESNIASFLDLLRFKNINPFFVAIYLNTTIGWEQIERIISGVGTPNINLEEIRSIKIPILSDTVQKSIESEYKKISKYHDKAMKAKKNNDEMKYKKNIETAEKMLKDLIAKTEAVIRSERDDVI